MGGITTMKIDIVNRRIRKEAARWAVRMTADDELAPGESEAFQRWFMANEAHRNEFHKQVVLLKLSADLPEAERPKVVADVEKTWRRVGPWAVAASVMLALGIVGVIVTQQQSAPTPHITTASTTRDVTLPDGSVAHLNVRTDLQWLAASGERRVALLDGEALFEVKHDAAKPFTVVVNQSEIRVLGTHFNVRRRESSDVVVTVLEGTVRVSSRAGGEPTWTRTLHADEQLVYNNTGLVRDIHAAARANAAKWREGILEFEDETLFNIVEDLGRYTDRQIVVRDQRVAQLRLGGQLDVRKDVKSSLTLLEKLAPVAVHESGNDFILDYSQEPTQERR